MIGVGELGASDRKCTHHYPVAARDYEHRCPGEKDAQYGAEGPPKGEVVVVVGPPAATAATDQDEIDRLLDQVLEGESLRDAVDAVAAATGAPRKTVYARALARREGGKDGA